MAIIAMLVGDVVVHGSARRDQASIQGTVHVVIDEILAPTDPAAEAS